MNPLFLLVLSLLFINSLQGQSFEVKGILETREFPASVSLDLNGDTYLDLLILNRRFDESVPAHLYLNDQTGEFTLVDTLARNDGVLKDFAGQMDFDQDGIPDLLCRKRWYKGEGDGSFMASDYEGFTSCLSVGDLNQDSVLDLFVLKEGTPLTSEPDSLVVLYSLLPSGYEEQILDIDTSIFSLNRRARVIDFNQDGQSEILLDPQVGFQRQLFFLGDSGIVAKKDFTIEGELYGDLYIEDLEGDGDLDIFYNGSLAFDEPYWLAYEDSSFSSPIPYPFPRDFLPYPIHLNEDERIDFLTGQSFIGSGYRLADSLGLGGLGALTLFSELDVGVFYAFDWDKDGDQDVVFNSIREGVQLIENTSISDSVEVVSNFSTLSSLPNPVRIYPNPTQTTLQIIMPLEEPYQIKIYNQHFQLLSVKHGLSSDASIGVEDLVPGTYHIQVIGKQLNGLGTFVKY